MPKQKSAKLSLHQPTHYRIIVQGVLSEEWQDYFSGFTLTRCPQASPIGLAILTSEPVNHPLLLGTLNTLYTLGFPLFKVEWIAWDTSA